MAKAEQFYRIEKIVVNVGVGEAAKDKAIMQSVGDELTAITGQKPSFRKAKKAIAGFKVRKGDVVGVAVTLRGNRMKTFLGKLIKIVLPKIRHFRGVSLTGFDGRGNYNLGIVEQVVFPEIDYTKVKQIRGMQITIVTNTGSDQESLKLLKALGMPFVRQPADSGQALKEKNG